MRYLTHLVWIYFLQLALYRLCDNGLDRSVQIVDPAVDNISTGWRELLGRGLLAFNGLASDVV